MGLEWSNPVCDIPRPNCRIEVGEEDVDRFLRAYYQALRLWFAPNIRKARRRQIFYPLGWTNYYEPALVTYCKALKKTQRLSRIFKTFYQDRFPDLIARLFWRYVRHICFDVKVVHYRGEKSIRLLTADMGPLSYEIFGDLIERVDND